jgi:hypothetical protein
MQSYPYIIAFPKRKCAYLRGNSLKRKQIIYELKGFAVVPQQQQPIDYGGLLKRLHIFMKKKHANSILANHEF